MTAEQKYLKALAEWLDIETIPKNRIQEASREYLDQFVSVNEKVEPAWKPEVGKLYKRDCGTVYEYKGIRGQYAMFSALDGSKAKVYPPENIPLIPIAELEGLKEGDKAWCISGSGEAEYYTIESVFSNNLTAHCGKGYLSIYLDGSACMFGGGKQLFYRTADRAERFGRGDA